MPYWKGRIVYIAGPMAGLPAKNRPAFAAAEKELKSRGAIVLNPANLPDGMQKWDYMPIYIAMLDRAQTIYMLEGSRESEGAMLELAYAHYQGIETVWEEEELG